MKTHACIVILSFWVLSTMLPTVVGEDPSLDGDISFQPNIIPELEIKFVEEFFRFQWLENRFDLKLLIHWNGKNHSLKDFWRDTGKVVTWQNMCRRATESMYEFGYMIEDIPQEVADNVEFLVWKIEGASFDVDEIELEEIEFLEEGYNVTRFHLPDNLVLSYEDLLLYDFTVSHPNKHETIIKGVKGKTSWNLDPITYSSPTITVIGGTEGAPLDFKDIWDADQANGWNVVANNNNTDTQFEFNCKLYFGNGTVAGTTYFNDTAKQIVFTDNIVSAHYESWMYLSRYSYLGFGELDDASEKSTSRGCSFISLETAKVTYINYVSTILQTEMNYYSCLFNSPRGLYISASNTKLYNSIGTYRITVVDHPTSNIFNFIMENSGAAINHPRGTWDRVMITESAQMFYTFYAGSISNLYGRGNIVIGYMHGGFDDPEVLNLTNPDIDLWAFTWIAGSTGEVFRLYTFDLTFTFDNGSYAEGTNVTISNSYLGTSNSWILTANGSIPEQIYSYGHYNQTGGNTIYDYNPYNITATLDGYQTYSQLINVTQKEDLTIALQPYEEAGYNWFAATIIIGIFACFMTIYALTTKT